MVATVVRQAGAGEGPRTGRESVVKRDMPEHVLHYERDRGHAAVVAGEEDGRQAKRRSGRTFLRRNEKKT
ncbi:hypothetical protein NL676_034791 [Syzygium grande]|nr:hypothetical protein NL676_034791 [Syzygium grande]